MLKFIDFHCRIICRRFSVISAVIIISASLVHGQNEIREQATSGGYQNEAVVVEQFDTTFTYQKDGSVEKILSMRIKVTSKAGMRQFSVIPLPYTADSEIPKIEMVRVRHPDGTSTDCA